MIQNEEHAVFVVKIKIKDLAAVPESAFQFVHVQGGMSPVIAEKSKLGQGDTPDLGRK